MSLFTQSQIDQLLRNGIDHRKDHFPVVRILIEEHRESMLLTALRSVESMKVYGLIDSGDLSPAMEYLDLHEFEEMASRSGFRIFTDPEFTAHYPISIYAEAARQANVITTDRTMLEQMCKDLKAVKAPILQGELF